jgi:hypothetical protein
LGKQRFESADTTCERSDCVLLAARAGVSEDEVGKRVPRCRTEITKESREIGLGIENIIRVIGDAMLPLNIVTFKKFNLERSQFAATEKRGNEGKIWGINDNDKCRCVASCSWI